MSKEFDFAVHFLNSDFGIVNISLDEGVLFESKKTVECKTCKCVITLAPPLLPFPFDAIAIRIL